MDKCRLDLTINRSKIVGLDDGKDGSNWVGCYEHDQDCVGLDQTLDAKIHDRL